MKCLITGINGFVGSYLSEYLLKKRLTVSGTVYPANATENIKDILNKINIFSCDLSNPQDIDNAVRETKPDLIFHLAGQSHIPTSWQKPAETFSVNVLGTIYLLESVKKYCPLTKTLIVCSCDEYGHTFIKEKVKENSPLLPENPYAVSKMCADIMSGLIGEYHNLNVVRVRPFNHTGPKQTDGFVLPYFAKQIAMIESGKIPPILRVGNIEAKRDFLDVQDIVNGYWLAITKGKKGEIYNISTGKSYKIKNLLKTLLDFSNAKIKIELDNSKFRPHDSAIKWGSSSKFFKDTGWKPKITIQTTLKSLLEYWRKQQIA